MSDEQIPQQVTRAVEQTFWGKVKEYLYGAVGAVFAILLGVIYALFQKNARLERDKTNLEEENEVMNARAKYQEQLNKANSAESDYESLKREYDSSSDTDPESKS